MGNQERWTLVYSQGRRYTKVEGCGVWCDNIISIFQTTIWHFCHWSDRDFAAGLVAAMKGATVEVLRSQKRSWIIIQRTWQRFNENMKANIESKPSERVGCKELVKHYRTFYQNECTDCRLYRMNASTMIRWDIRFEVARRLRLSGSLAEAIGGGTKI